ncbi:MAG: L-threonylcarbamoyladenylate synthase [Victivallaceae bacterium]
MQQFLLKNVSQESIISACVECLKIPGTVLLVPTETVYGLVCRWNDPQGVAKIYELKSREAGKPLAMFAADTAMLRANGVILDDAAGVLTEKFCPGPITIIANNTSGTKTGFRIPDYPFIAALLKALNYPLASTSANLSGTPNALTVADAVRDLCGSPDMVIDAGAIPADRQASTVVDASANEVKILRPGPISATDIMRVL